MPENLNSRLRLGYIIFGALVASKAVEYLVITLAPRGAWPYLTVLALVGAWLILYYFMHIRDLARRGKDDE